MTDTYQSDNIILQFMDFDVVQSMTRLISDTPKVFNFVFSGMIKVNV